MGEPPSKRPCLELVADGSHVQSQKGESDSSFNCGSVPVFDFSGKTGEALASVVDALQGFGVELEETSITPDSVCLFPGGSRIGKVLAAVRQELLEGAGAVRIQGLRWPEEESLQRLQFLVLGASLGWHAVPQSTDWKELVADVIARPAEEGDRNYRGYRNPYAQKLHTDSNRPSSFGTGLCDIVALLLVHPSELGGISKLVSAETLHQVISAERPDLYERLCGGWPWDGERDWLPEWGPTKDIGEGLPLLWKIIGGTAGPRCAVQYGEILRQNVEAGFAARVAENSGNAIDSIESEALDYLEQVANREDLLMSLKLRKNEVLLLNNYAWMHGRSEFPELESDGSRRHVLRMWLKLKSGLT